MIELLNWIKDNGWTAFWVGVFILIVIEKIGRAINNARD